MRLLCKHCFRYVCVTEGPWFITNAICSLFSHRNHVCVSSFYEEVPLFRTLTVLLWNFGKLYETAKSLTNTCAKKKFHYQSRLLNSVLPLIITFVLHFASPLCEVARMFALEMKIKFWPPLFVWSHSPWLKL